MFVCRRVAASCAGVKVQFLNCDELRYTSSSVIRIVCKFGGACARDGKVGRS